jgi:creatinine amidohydrolase/Fe(II)-dependent formamide hydrolase-like protein
VWAVVGSVVSAQERATKKRHSSAAARSKIYKLEELNWPQIDALERERTLVILPVGMIEEHGPHLPVGADTLGVLYEAEGVSRQVSQALSDWNIVMLPSINYGQGGANEIGAILVHPGTYGIRQSTLRSLVADIGGQIAQNGFKWIFVLNFSAAEVSSFGMDVHAGVGETSAILAIRPDLVRSDYKTLPDRAGRTLRPRRSKPQHRNQRGVRLHRKRNVSRDDDSPVPACLERMPRSKRAARKSKLG